MASYGDMRPRRPLIQGSPRSAYAAAGTQPSPQQPTAPASPPADPLRFGPLRGGTPGFNGTVPPQPPQTLDRGGPRAADRAGPAPTMPSSRTAGNSDGVSAPTPSVTAQQDQVSPRNVNSSGAVRQLQNAPPPGAPWRWNEGHENNATMTPFVGSFNPAPLEGDRDEGGIPEGGRAPIMAAPVFEKKQESAPAPAPSVFDPPVETKESALVAANPDGTTPEGVDDTGGEGVTQQDRIGAQIQKLADSMGVDYNTALTLYQRYHKTGWNTTFDMDADSGNATGWRAEREVPEEKITNNGLGPPTWTDPETGKEYGVEERDGKYYALDEGGDITEVDRNRAVAEGGRLPKVGPNGEPIVDTTDDETQAFFDTIKGIMELGSSPEDKKLLEDSVNESRNRFGYETGRNQLAAMEGSARAGLSADASSGTGAAIGQAGGIAGAQDETRIRLENRQQQLAAQLQGLQLQAAFAANAVERRAATEAAMMLMKEQGRINKQLAILQDKLNTPSVGQAIGGFLGGLVGSVGDAASFGIARKLSS